MKFEMRGKKYYVNSRAIGKETLRAIAAEIWDEQTAEFIFERLRALGSINIAWSYNKLVEIEDLESHQNYKNEIQNELQLEREKNQLLAAKYAAAVQLAVLNLKSA